MIINEEILRKIIVDHLIKEQVRSRGSIVPGAGTGSSDSSDESEDVNIDAVTKKGGKFYLGNISTGLSGDKFKKLMADMQNFINKEYPEVGIKIESLGIMRDLESAADTSNPNRIPGSKHGAGLALDVKYHTKKHGRYRNYEKNNAKLAKDPKFLKTLQKFNETQSDIGWGGTWGNSNPAEGMAQGKGITELHHWEIRDASVPEYFEKFPKVKKAIEDLGMTSKDMIKKDNRAKLYKALVSSAKKSS